MALRALWALWAECFFFLLMNLRIVLVQLHLLTEIV